MAGESAPPAQQPTTPQADAPDLADPGHLRAWAKANAGAEDRTKSRLQALMPGGGYGTAEVPFPKVARDDYVKAIQGAGVYKRALDVKPSRVPLAALTAVQRTVNAERLEKHLGDPNLIPKGTKGDHRGLVDHPTVVRLGGKHYIHDGHHRATAALVRGDKDILARVVDLDAVMKQGG